MTSTGVWWAVGGTAQAHRIEKEKLRNLNRLNSSSLMRIGGFSYETEQVPLLPPRSLPALPLFLRRSCATCLPFVSRHTTPPQLAPFPPLVPNVPPLSLQLRLGMLDGNHFAIVLRNISVAAGAKGEEVLRAAVEAWGRDGFINYFGLQA